MDGSVFIRKSLDGLYYIKGLENAAYDLGKLSTEYPQTKFIVINSTEKYPYHNVYNKAQLIEACGADGDLCLKCPGCKKKNLYNEYCKSCGLENPAGELLSAILGDNYKKAIGQLEVDRFFNKEGKTGKQFESYNAVGTNKDAFLLKLLRGYQRQF